MSGARLAVADGCCGVWLTNVRRRQPGDLGKFNVKPLWSNSNACNQNPQLHNSCSFSVKPIAILRIKHFESWSGLGLPRDLKAKAAWRGSSCQILAN